MKHPLKIIQGLFLIILLAIGCTPDYKGQYQKAVEAHYGTVTADHYSNAWLKAQLDLPAGWHVQEDPMKEAVVSAGAGIVDQETLDGAIKNIETISVYNLLQVFKNPMENQKTFNPSLVMMVERVDGKGVEDAADYLEASRGVMAQRQMPMGFKQDLEAPLDTVIFGGIEFTHLPVVIETSLFKINQDCYAALREGKMLNIMVTWRDEAEKTEMLKALDTFKIQ